VLLAAGVGASLRVAREALLALRRTALEAVLGSVSSGDVDRNAEMTCLGDDVRGFRALVLGR
jgi:hypothetical protein